MTSQIIINNLGYFLVLCVFFFHYELGNKLIYGLQPENLLNEASLGYDPDVESSRSTRVTPEMRARLLNMYLSVDVDLQESLSVSEFKNIIARSDISIKAGFNPSHLTNSEIKVILKEARRDQVCHITSIIYEKLLVVYKNFPQYLRSAAAFRTLLFENWASDNTTPNYSTLSNSLLHHFISDPYQENSADVDNEIDPAVRQELLDIHTNQFKRFLVRSWRDKIINFNPISMSKDELANFLKDCLRKANEQQQMRRHSIDGLL